MLGGPEDLLEVLALAGVDEVDDAVGAELADAEADGGEVGGAVEVAAVGLLDDQRALEAGDFDDGGAFALLGEALAFSSRDDVGRKGL